MVGNKRRPQGNGSSHPTAEANNNNYFLFIAAHIPPQSNFSICILQHFSMIRYLLSFLLVALVSAGTNQEGLDFLAKMKKEEGVIETPSGAYIGLPSTILPFNVALLLTLLLSLSLQDSCTKRFARVPVLRLPLIPSAAVITPDVSSTEVSGDPLWSCSYSHVATNKRLDIQPSLTLPTSVDNPSLSLLSRLSKDGLKRCK